MNDNKFQIIRSVEGAPTEEDFSMNFRHKPYRTPIVLDRTNSQLYAKNSDGVITRLSATTIIQGQPGPQGPVGPQGPSGSVEKSWPVGVVFFCANEANPEKLLGFWKWELMAKPTKTLDAYSWKRAG